MQFGTQLMFKSVQTTTLSALLLGGGRPETRVIVLGGLIFQSNINILNLNPDAPKGVLVFLNSLIKVQQTHQSARPQVKDSPLL